MDCSTSDFPVHHQLLESTQTHVHWVSEPSNHLILCHPLHLLLSIFPRIRVFSKESGLCNRWPSIGVSASTSVLPMKLRTDFLWIDWIDLLAVCRTLKSLLQHHSSKLSVHLCSVSLWSNSHIHTWLLEKTIALTRQTFVGKVMPLLFNMLSKLVIAFLPRSRHLSFSWLQSPFAVILETHSPSL